MPTIETYHLLLATAGACEDKKAEDIRILALDPNESGLTDYFLVCNGTNDRQNVAIGDDAKVTGFSWIMLILLCMFSRPRSGRSMAWSGCVSRP